MHDTESIWIKKTKSFRPPLWNHTCPTPHNTGFNIEKTTLMAEAFSNWPDRPIGMTFRSFLFYLITKPGSGLYISYFRQVLYFTPCLVSTPTTPWTTLLRYLLIDGLHLWGSGLSKGRQANRSIYYLSGTWWEKETGTENRFRPLLMPAL